ncbi:MAG: hypothetical protein ACON5K_00630 [Bacteroidia bacterium]
MDVRKIKIAPFILTVITVISACYNDNAEDLYGLQSCDTTAVTYSSDISPIINSQCASCHSNSSPSAGIAIHDYNSTVSYVNTNKKKLLGSVKWDGTASNMPKGGSKWNACNINKLEAWINQGMKP